MSSAEEAESSSEVEETSEEAGTGDSDGSSEHDVEKPKEKPKAKAPAAGEKVERGKKSKEKHLVSSKSHVAEGRAKTEVKKTFFGSADSLTFECSMASGAVKAGSNLEVHVVIKNDSPKSVKSIEAWLRVFKGKPKGKGKKVRRPKPKKMDGTEQEYFQGARFPLQGHVGYDGTITYPLPKKLDGTSEILEYELVVNFDVSGTIGWNHVQAFLPVQVKD